MAEQKIQITADNETRRGHYSNQHIIALRKEEFIIDFLLVDPHVQTPGEGRAVLTSRIILNPEHMKRLYQRIGANIKKYEKSFGTIVLPPTME